MQCGTMAACDPDPFRVEATHLPSVSARLGTVRTFATQLRRSVWHCLLASLRFILAQSGDLALVGSSERPGDKAVVMTL